MNRKNGFLRFLLMPVALIYGFITALRNVLFDLKILPSEKFPLPVICVGNIAAGGTGKTPFTEYLIDLLKGKYRVAMLSRGYKRRTRGFMFVAVEHSAADVGDEACQLKHKYPGITIAVDASRRNGIRQLLALPVSERPEVIILDDAMQHRYVTPSLTIMLTDYNNMYYEDYMLPVGDLRESSFNVYRADIVIVTRCVGDIKPISLRIIDKNMSLMAHQLLCFSEVQYLDLQPVFPDAINRTNRIITDFASIASDTNILLITGIANPQSLINKINTVSSHVQVFTFPDHHEFTPEDIERIDLSFRKLDIDKSVIITTEKDSMRLKMLDYLPDTWKPLLYYVPIKMKFLFGRDEQFNSRVLSHVLSTINIYNNKSSAYEKKR